jgi:membrane protein
MCPLVVDESQPANRKKIVIQWSVLARIRHIISLNLSEVEHNTQSKWVRIGIRNLRIVVHVGRVFFSGKHTQRAAALTYFSLLSLVPLLAVVFSLFKAFGGLAKAADQLKAYVIDNLAYEDSQNQVSGWLDQFVSSFHAGAVGTVGMIALLITLILTLATIEDSLNHTWGIRSRRAWSMRLIVYWSLLTVGPLLLGGSLAITASVQSSAVAIWAKTHIPMFGFLQGLVPIAFTSLAFSALYLIMPAARVRWTAALTGGVVAGVMFEFAKLIYTVYVAKAVSRHVLYGSLAALPFFIIWVNYSWRVVLFGADVAHAIQYLSTDPTEESDPRTNQATREEAAMRICAAIAAAFAHGKPPPSTLQLSSQLLLPAHLTETLCAHLTTSGLIREVMALRRQIGFVPGKPLNDLTAADVVRVLRHQVGIAHWGIAGDSKDLIDNLLLGAENQMMLRLSEVRWSDLAEQDASTQNTRRQS